MVSTGIAEIDKLLGGDGYPDRSTILVVGPPGIGKEALGYWFIDFGLTHGDACAYATRLGVSEVIADIKAFRIDGKKNSPVWIASQGGEIKLDVNDLPGLSHNIKELLRTNSGKRVRIVTDVLSSLLMLYPSDTIYRFLTQLFSEIKQFDAVFVATLEEGMHSPQVLAAMEQLFDGVVELKLYEEGLRVLPLLRIRKMRGVPPQPGYFNFSFSRAGMEVTAFGK